MNKLSSEYIIRRINKINFAVSSTQPECILFPEDILIHKKKSCQISRKDLFSILIEGKDFIPLSVRWEITSRCNLNCPFCYIHGIINSPDYSYEEAKTIIDSLHSMGTLYVTLTGGECTLNNDFDKIYKYLRKNGFIVKVLTNGTCISKSTLEIFEKYLPKRVEITLYNPVDIDSKPYLTILKLKDMNISVLAKFTITKDNFHLFSEIKSWCSNHDILFKFDYNIHPTYNNTDQNDLNINYYQKSILLKQLKSNTSFFEYRSSFKCFDCRGGRYSFLITADRKVKSCGRVKYYSEIIDNQVLNSMKEVNNYVLRFIGKEIIKCKSCTANNICNVCFADLDNNLMPKQNFCNEKRSIFQEMNSTSKNEWNH